MVHPVRGCPEHKVPLDEIEKPRPGRSWSHSVQEVLRCPQGHDATAWIVLDAETGKVLIDEAGQRILGPDEAAGGDLEEDERPEGEVQFPLTPTGTRYARRKTHGIVPDEEDDPEEN